jgi:hypothetical protein
MAEVVYMQDTVCLSRFLIMSYFPVSFEQKDPVIVQVPIDFDIEPFLGAHCWRDFLVPYDPNNVQVSEIYEYKWCDNGDPANRKLFLHVVSFTQRLVKQRWLEG